MDRSKFADLSEIVSSIAILLTLIYLAVEIRQNTHAIHAQSRQSVLAGVQNELFSLMENPAIVESIIKAGPLTQEENIRLDLFLTSAMKAREFSWLQFRDGFIDDAQWQAELLNVRAIFDSARTRRWWANSGRAIFSSKFVEVIDGELQSSPPTESVWNASANWSAQ